MATAEFVTKEFRDTKPAGLPPDEPIAQTTTVFEVTLESVVQELHTMLGRFDGIPEKINQAKDLVETEKDRKPEVERIRKFVVNWARALINDPKTRYFVYREQARHFKNIVRSAKSSEVHSDITAVAETPAKSPKDVGRIPHLLGVGGFGQVYGAPGINGVIKVLRPRQGNDIHGARIRLAREKRAHARLSQKRESSLNEIARAKTDLLEQNLSKKELGKHMEELRLREQDLTVAASVLGEGKLSTDEEFFAQQWIPGEDCRDVFKDGPLSLDKAAALLYAICKSLSKVHEAGLVHRDIKPENIKVQENSEPGVKYRAKVMDFGLSRLIDLDEEMDEIDRTMTVAGTILGSSLYMSPDQALSDAKVPSNDTYSLAVMWVEAVTGNNPREGKLGTSSLSIGEYLRKEKEDPSLLVGGLNAYGMDAVEVARAFMRGDVEQAMFLLKDLAEGRRGPISLRLAVKFKVILEKFQTLSKTATVVLAMSATAIVATLIGLMVIGKTEKKEEDEAPELMGFVTSKNGLPDLELRRPVLDENMQKTMDKFTIESGVAFYENRGDKKRLFALVGAYSGRELANYERRNIELIYEEHLKKRRAIHLFDGEPGADPTFSTMNDGHNFTMDKNKVTPYSTTGGLLSDSLFLREFGNREKTIGQHFQDPAYIQLVNNLPVQVDEVNLFNSDIFKGMKEESYGRKEWKSFMENEIKRMKDTFEKKRNGNSVAPKKTSHGFVPDQLRNQLGMQETIQSQKNRQHAQFLKDKQRDRRTV